MSEDRGNKNTYTILLTSNEPWGDIWFSKQHYANELAKLGHTVYFLNAPTSWKPWHFFSTRVDVHKEKENLYIVEYDNPFPLKFLSHFFGKFNSWLNGWKLRRKLLLDSNQRVIWWQFDPTRFFSPVKNRKESSVYHVVDPYMNWRFDQRLKEEADLIICTNQHYLKYYRGALYIPHGIAPDEFSIDQDKVEQIKRAHGNYLVFVGTINHSTSLRLIELLGENKLPVLILGKVVIQGQESLKYWERLLDLTSITYLGPKPATVIKNYIRAAKAGLVLYPFAERTHTSRSPLKILNYLAQAKPVILAEDPELGFIDNGIYLAKDEQSFIDLCKLGLSDSLYVNIKGVKNYLKHRSYPSLIEQILNKTINETSTN